MIMELQHQDLVKCWTARNLVWSIDCDLLRIRCGLGSSVGCCSGSEGGRSDRKTEGAEKTHGTSHPKMEDSSIVVDGWAVTWAEVLKPVGSKGSLDGSSPHAIAHRTAQANK